MAGLQRSSTAIYRDTEPLKHTFTEVVMKIFIVLMLLSGSVMAQLTDKDIDEEVSAIMKEVQTLDGLNKLTKSQKAYVTGGGSGYLTVYEDQTGRRKLVLTFDGDGASGAESYYFRHGALLCQFTTWTSYPQWEDQVETTTESRNYFLISGARIRCETREYSGEATPFEPSEPRDWNAAQEDILARADRLQRFFDSTSEDLDGFE